MENLKTSASGYTLTGELKNVPVAFVNGLRRILLAEIPAVVLTNVEILENTSKLTHEMLRLRMEQIPVNVLPSETGVIRDTKVEVRYLPSAEPREVLTSDFAIAGPRKDVLLKDRDLETPGLFVNLGPNETLHMRASLGIETRGVVQCVASFSNHIDPERAKLDRDTWILEGNDPRVFDNFYIQRSYAINEAGRPYWFDLTVDSIGIQKAKDLLKTACEIYKAKIEEFAALPIQRYDTGRYRMKMAGDPFTVGCLVQTILYESGLVEWVTYMSKAKDEHYHPLVPQLVVEFDSKVAPEKVVERFKQEALALCENVLKSV
jgi:hypothetical protein